MSSTYKSKGKVGYPSYLKYNRKLKVQGLLTLKVKQLSGEIRIQTQVFLIPEPVLFPRHYMTFQDASLSRSNYQCLPLKHRGAPSQKTDRYGKGTSDPLLVSLSF